jgi:hypothetical protein
MTMGTVRDVKIHRVTTMDNISPEHIWRWAVPNSGGFIEWGELPVISENATQYTRTDLFEAQAAGIAELKLMLDERDKYIASIKLFKDAERDKQAKRIAELEAQLKANDAIHFTYSDGYCETCNTTPCEMDKS